MTSPEPPVKAMKEEHSYTLKDFPRTWYYPKWRLIAWHPRGVFDNDAADQIIEFIEREERIQETPFDRYTDLSGLTLVELDVDHVFKIARRRRKVAQPVNSAFFADKPVTLSVARLYEMLMHKAMMIEVRVFRERQAAAEWLDVPLRVLHPPAETEASKRLPGDRKP